MRKGFTFNILNNGFSRECPWAHVKHWDSKVWVILIGYYFFIMVDPLANSPTTPIKTHQTYKIWYLACALEHTLDKPNL